MTQEQKQLLLVDLCARLPHNVIVDDKAYVDDKIELSPAHIYEYFAGTADLPKPYLRPMSSMTEEEMEEYNNLWELDRKDIFPIGKKLEEEYSKKNYNSVWEHPIVPLYRHIDWLNAHHFDYRGLIDKGLALEAPKDIYSRQ